MSNNGINSATNGRTSANNTSHATHNNANAHVHAVAGAGGGGVSGTVAAKTSINLKNPKISNNIMAAGEKMANTATTTNTAQVPTSDGGKDLAHMSIKSNNNDHSQGPHHHQQQYVNIKKVSVNSNSSSHSSSHLPSQQQHHQPLVVNVNKLPTHRRDSSNVSGHNTHTGGIVPQSLKDASKYRYIRPQTLYRAEDHHSNQQDEVDRGDRRVVAPIPHTYHDDNDDDRVRKELNDTLLVYYDGQLEGGSLDALIEHMVPTHCYYPDRIYTFSFLLSARLFIRPHELLAKISQTWEKQQQQQQQHQQSGTVVMANTQDQVDDAGHFTATTAAGFLNNSPLTQRKPSATGGGGGGGVPTNTQKSAQNCIRLLAEWIETFPYDFRDERLMQQVRILTRKCVYIDNSLGKQVSRILQLLVQRLTALEKYEEFLQSLQQYDLNNTLQPHYSTSASASYSSTSSSSSAASASNVIGHNSLTKASVQALNSHLHHDTVHQHKNNYLSNAQYSHTHGGAVSSNIHSNSIVPPSSSTSSTGSSATTAAGADSPNAHDVYGIMDLCPSCAQLAHQLTAIELDRLSHIGPEEFVQAFAKEYQNSITNSANNSSSAGGGGGSNSSSAAASGHVMSTSLNDMKKTRNLESYVEWFNRLSYLTASEIVKVCIHLYDKS